MILLSTENSKLSNVATIQQKICSKYLSWFAVTILLETTTTHRFWQLQPWNKNRDLWFRIIIKSETKRYIEGIKD